MIYKRITVLMVFFRDIYEFEFLKIIFVDSENKFGYILLPVLVNNFTKFKDHPKFKNHP